MTAKMIDKTIVISGGFDPLHVGHLNMIQAAAQLGDVTVVLNSDEWLINKKGYVFMPYKERNYLLKQLKGVVAVSAVDDSDGTVCEALQRLKPDIFGNGGDRTLQNTPEVELCVKLNIATAWKLGGEKIQSSRGLINTLFAKKPIRSELDDFKRILDNMPS